LNFTGKNSKIAFCATLSGDLDVHGSSMACRKRVIDFLLVLIEHFPLSLTVETL